MKYRELATKCQCQIKTMMWYLSIHTIAIFLRVLALSSASAPVSNRLYFYLQLLYKKQNEIFSL
jgi:hypothetical protein